MATGFAKYNSKHKDIYCKSNEYRQIHSVLAALLTNNPWEQSLDICCFTDITVAVHGGGVACYSDACGGVVQRQLQTAETPQQQHLSTMMSCPCQNTLTCRRCIATQLPLHVFLICLPENLPPTTGHHSNCLCIQSSTRQPSPVQTSTVC